MASTTLSLLSYLRIPVAATSAIVASLSGLLWWNQKFALECLCTISANMTDSEIIYPRTMPPGSRTKVPRPSEFPQYGIRDYEELTIPTPDNELLHAFLIRPSKRHMKDSSKVTVIAFHGNAGNIGHRLPIAGMLNYHYPCNVLMVEYRGYGLSTGSPNEKGLNIDAQAGLDYIRKSEELMGSKIVVYGQSIGGAVAIQLVARNQDAGDIRALILENTFTSIRKLIPRYGHRRRCSVVGY
ncbi:hypothetical protein MRB53_039872 [Persea americana]|nr:hypothetical protein MRB53_039872 [Persea americana]